MDLPVLAAALEPYRNRRRWWLAYSGGVDSHVLLHAVAALAGAGGYPPLSALHVNHGLNPRAGAWADHCRGVCAALGVELRVVEVEVRRNGGLGLEAAARQARYGAFERTLAPGELLLQAHHGDDQAETLLLRLLRGAGPAGLAGIPAQRILGRGELLRPLLGQSRAALLAYAEQHGLDWIHDDSNDDECHDRNYLRHRVLPLLEQRWPACRATLGRAALQAGEADVLLHDLAALDLAAARRGEALDIPTCMTLSEPRRRNLLRHWLRALNLPLPGREQLQQVLAQMTAAADAQICVSWPGAQVLRFRDALYALPPLVEVADLEMPWPLPRPLSPPALGTLRAAAVSGRGLRADRTYQVRNRRGGERCKPQGRAHSQSLKKLLQEADVPPWRRDRLPLIWCDGQLAAVADLWICEGYAAQSDQPGWAIEWDAPA